MKTKRIAGMATVLFALLFCLLGVTTVKAQPTTGPGIDPNSRLLIDFEDGDISGWTTNKINAGNNNPSIELMDANNGDPVRFGRHAIKLNWDFRTGSGTIGNLYNPPSASFKISASENTANLRFGMWIYVSPECNGNLWFRIQMASPAGAAGAGGNAVSVWGGEFSYDMNWTGWKYCEFSVPNSHYNKELGPYASATPSYAVFRFLQVVGGTRQQTNGYVIIDNMRISTGAEDRTAPAISALTGNGTNLDGATFDTRGISLSATYNDPTSNTSGINAVSARFIVNGVAYKTGDTGFSSDATTATLTGLNLPNGSNTVVMHIEDNFGHITTKSATFTVSGAEGATFSVEPDAVPYVGNIFNMKVNTTSLDDVKGMTVIMDLEGATVAESNGVIFATSAASESTYSFNASTGRLTLNIVNDVSVASGSGTVATIKANIPINSDENAALRVTPVSTNVTYGDNSSSSISLFSPIEKQVKAVYNLTVLKRIIGVTGEIIITDQSQNPVPGVTVTAYDIAGTDGIGALIASGTTDANGIASFNFATAQKNIFLSAGKNGSYSYIQNTLMLLPRLSNKPSGIRSGTTEDPSTSKTITWMSNITTSAAIANVKLAEKPTSGSPDFILHTGETKMLEFGNAVSSSTSGVSQGSRVTLNGLKPGTTYIYQVGDGTNWSDEMEFTTASNSDKFSFSAYGDLQASNTGDMSLWLAASNTVQELPIKPFFSLNVGDIVDADTRWDYHTYYSYLFDQRPSYSTIDMVSSYGNHEYIGSTKDAAPNYKFLAGHPKAAESSNYNAAAVGDGSYYAVYGNMLVIGLDWEPRGGGYSAATRQTEQAKWMDEVFTAHADKTWKIVTLHYPIYPSESTPGSQSRFQDLFEKHNVQVVFCGHGHTFRRAVVQNKTTVQQAANTTAFVALPSGQKTLHWEMGGMAPNTGVNSRKWVLAEVDGGKINFTTRDANNDIVANQSFTLYATDQHAEQFDVTFNKIGENGTLTAFVNDIAITSGDKVYYEKEVVFTANPASGYKVKAWMVDGIEYSAAADSPTLTLTIKANVDVKVEFTVLTSASSTDDQIISIYPNPFTDVLRIKGASYSTLRITDIAGALIHSQEIADSDAIIRSEHISPGVYFFRIEKDKQVKTLKVVKK